MNYRFQKIKRTRKVSIAPTSILLCDFLWVKHYSLHLLALLLLMSKTSLYSDQMISGSAIITSCKGKIEVTNQEGESIRSKLHSTLLPNGLNFKTRDKSRLFMTLSNGVALGIDGEASVQCAEYVQLPFNMEEQSRRIEASVSRLHLKYENGLIAIAGNYLSPLSEIKILLPDGELRLYKGSCLIEKNATELRIIATEGTLTYYYNGSNKREYITAPESISLDNARKKAIVNMPVDSLDPRLSLLTRATQHASRRVQFQPNKGSGQAPEPVLIVRPEYFEQPAKRPYEFKD